MRMVFPKHCFAVREKEKYRTKYSGERKVHIRKHTIRSYEALLADRLREEVLQDTSAPHSGISGSKEGRAVFKFAEGLRKTVVRTADGRTSDDRICARRSITG